MKSQLPITCLLICFCLQLGCGSSEPPPTAEQLQAVEFMQGLQTQTRDILVKHLKDLYPDPNHVDEWQLDKEALFIGLAAAEEELNPIWESATRGHFVWVRQWMNNRIVEDFSKAPLRFSPAPSDAAPHQVIADFSTRTHPEKMVFRLDELGESWTISEAWLYPSPQIVDKAGADDFALSYFENTFRITSAHNHDFVWDYLPWPQKGTGYSVTGDMELRSMHFRFSSQSDIFKFSMGQPGTGFYTDAAIAGYLFGPEFPSPEIAWVIPHTMDESEYAYVWVRLLNDIFRDTSEIRFSLKSTEDGWRLVDIPEYRIREAHFEFQKPTGSKDWQYAPPANGR